jgi:polyisoprenoid-binding protein YceI
MMVGRVRGNFGKVAGQARFDPARPEAARVSAQIDVASIDTGDAERDAHLKHADFFDIATHPKAAFGSRRIRRKSRGSLEIVGDLTIRGVTREVCLEVDEPSSSSSDHHRMTLHARTTLRRSAFGLQWSELLETGGVVVSDEVSIELAVTLVADERRSQQGGEAPEWVSSVD